MPTAQPRWPSAVKCTLWSQAWVPLVCGVHALPPSLVARIVPSMPTAQPRWPSAVKCTLLSQAPVPLVCGVHALPPSLVARIVPSMPTAQPRWPSAVKCTLVNKFRVPLVCGVHELPPSRVARIVPFSPTAQPRRSVAKNTAFRSAWSGPGPVGAGTASGALASVFATTAPGAAGIGVILFASGFAGAGAALGLLSGMPPGLTTCAAGLAATSDSGGAFSFCCAARLGAACCFGSGCSPASASENGDQAPALACRPPSAACATAAGRCCTQLLPPSALCRTRPPSPTAQTFCVFGRTKTADKLPTTTRRLKALRSSGYAHQSALPMSQSATGRNMSGCGAWRCARKVATASRVMTRVISAQRSQPGIRKRLRGSCTRRSGWSEGGSSRTCGACSLRAGGMLKLASESKAAAESISGRSRRGQARLACRDDTPGRYSLEKE